MIVNPRRAGGFAGATSQAAIEMQLGGRACRIAFQHRLYQVDSPARTVIFIAEQLVSGAGCSAETAMRATAQDRIGLPALALQLISLFRLRDHSDGYIRPGLNTPAGSNSFFSRCCRVSKGPASGVKTPNDLASPRNRVAWPPALIANSLTLSAGSAERNQHWPPFHSSKRSSQLNGASLCRWASAGSAN